MGSDEHVSPPESFRTAGQLPAAIYSPIGEDFLLEESKAAGDWSADLKLPSRMPHVFI